MSIVIFSSQLDVAFRAPAVMEINDSRTGVVSSYPREAGSAASDAFTEEQPSVRFVIGVSNTQIGRSPDLEAVSNARSALQTMFSTGELWTVTHEGRVWENMTMTELTETTTPRTGGAMLPTIVFRKIQLVEMVTQQIPEVGEAFAARDAQNLLDEAAEGEADNGDQGGDEIDPNASIAARANIDVAIERFGSLLGGS